MAYYVAITLFQTMIMPQRGYIGYDALTLIHVSLCLHGRPITHACSSVYRTFYMHLNLPRMAYYYSHVSVEATSFKQAFNYIDSIYLYDLNHFYLSCTCTKSHIETLEKAFKAIVKYFLALRDYQF